MRRIAVLFFAGCISLSACATVPIPYNWSGYSSSLYGVKKEPSDEKLHAHKLVLMQIIQGSDGKPLRVPPGIYAEYGYILVKEGKTEEGIKYLDLEAQTFPEAKVFIERVKAQAIRPTDDKDRKE